MTTTLLTLIPWILGAIAALAVLAWLGGVRYIPHSRVGIIEKLWSAQGSLVDGRIVASGGMELAAQLEASGYEAFR